MSESEQLPVAVYTPESQVRSPKSLIKKMCRDIGASRELAWRFFVRDISAQYRQSVLGIFWAFAPPIVTGLIFVLLHSKKIVNFGETDIPYPVYAIVGTTLWSIFADSTTAPLRSVQKGKSIIAKINFPREALILAAFYETLFKAVIRVPIIIGILMFFGISINVASLFAIPMVLLLIFLGLTIGLVLTPIGMLYTDIGSALGVAVQLWFFVTPVVYPPPTSFPFSLVVTLNPVSSLLLGSRDLLTKGTLTHVDGILFVSILMIIFFFVAWGVYRLAMPILTERMSA